MLLLISGCTVGRGNIIIPPGADETASPALSGEDDGADHKIIIANGLSEDISVLERNNGNWKINTGEALTGQSPNQISIRNGKIYIINSLSNSIEILDEDNYSILMEISTGNGTNPVNMDFIDDDTIAVSCYLTNEVIIVNVSQEPDPSDRIIKRTGLPSGDDLPRDPGVAQTWARPGGIVVHGNSIYAVCANLESLHTAGGPGLLVQIDKATFEISDQVELSGRDTIGLIHSGRYPERLIISSAGSYDFQNGFAGNGMIESFDIDSDVIFQAIDVHGAPFHGEIGFNDILYLENGSEGKVIRVDLKEGRELDNVEIPGSGPGLSFASAIAPLPGLLIVAEFNSDRILLFDPVTDSLLAELQAGDGPDAIGILY